MLEVFSLLFLFMDQSPAKRLTRSTNNKIIAGVCGGLGDYFNVDPMIVRILFVALTIWGGSGVLLYIILWLVVPEAGQEALPTQQRMDQVGHDMQTKVQDAAKNIQGRQSAKSLTVIIGAILVVLGLSSIIQIYVPWPLFRWEIFWPIIIIALGLSLIIKRK